MESNFETRSTTDLKNELASAKAKVAQSESRFESAMDHLSERVCLTAEKIQDIKTKFDHGKERLENLTSRVRQRPLLAVGLSLFSGLLVGRFLFRRSDSQ